MGGTIVRVWCIYSYSFIFVILYASFKTRDVAAHGG